MFFKSAKHHVILVMDLDRLCTLLGDVDMYHLKEGFSQLLALFPNSSCESIQLVNLVLPLTLDLLRSFYTEEVMVQVNHYFYVKVSVLLGLNRFVIFYSMHVRLWIL